MEITNENLMTCRQAAVLVGVSRRCVQNLCKQHKVNYWTIGGRFLVDYQSVLDYFHRAPSEHIKGRKPKSLLPKE